MDWRRGPTIGRGSSAAVSLATTAAGQLFAVKSTDVSSSTSLRNEEVILAQFTSPFVVQCFGSDVTREKDDTHVFNLFLEYVPGGTLSDLIRRQGGSLDEHAIQFYAHQLLQGLNYLHSKGLVHCDIKGRNLLIGADGLKIADFGCAKWLGQGKGSFAGTPAYMAPEVALGLEQGFPADVWALGCTIIEMATGSNPWPEIKDPAALLYRVAYSGDVPEFPGWFSDTAKQFLGKCLARDVEERWTAAELLRHPFFSSVEAKCGEGRELAGKSPTSVMDQCFWDAMEISDSSRNPTAAMGSSRVDSPAGRIMGLAGGGILQNLHFADWTEEEDQEDWVTVRGDESEDSSRDRYDDSEDLNYESLFDEDIVSVIAIEGSFFNCLSDDIIVGNLTSGIVSDGGGNDSFSGIVVYDQTVMEFSFPNLDRLFGQSWSHFGLSSHGIILLTWNLLEMANLQRFFFPSNFLRKWVQVVKYDIH